MGVLDVWLLFFVPYPGLYNKTHLQSVYNEIRRKLKPGYIVIINLFQWIISLYSLSHQMTSHVQFEVEKQQILITVYIYICMN